MQTFRWWQGTADITRRITQGASGGNSVAKYLTAVAAGAMRSFESASTFNPAHDR
jgi:hypothetical protein